MKRIIIELTDEQYKKLYKEMQRGQEMNTLEETHSGMEFSLSTTDDGAFAYLDFKMLYKIELGEVNWKIM